MDTVRKHANLEISHRHMRCHPGYASGNSDAVDFLDKFKLVIPRVSPDPRQGPISLITHKISGRKIIVLYQPEPGHVSNEPSLPSVP